MILKNFLQKLPLFTKLRHRLSAYLLREILPALHPLKTDKPLIRVGASRDGGYLIPDDLDNIYACFSPGVDNVSDFENECAKRGMRVFLADASVDAPAVKNDLFHFRKSYIGEKSEGSYISMNDWITESIGGQDCDLIMQMDIEGHEYKALNAMSDENLKRFRIIVIEFHGLNFLREYKVNAFKKILKTHSCVHIHPNNCEPITRIRNLEIPNLMEFTFLRNDRIKSREYQNQFPHLLDSNNVNSESVILPKCWFRTDA